MRFKGTIGVVKMLGDQVLINNKTVYDCENHNLPKQETLFNALLASKAYEMLQMLDDVKDYLGSDKRAKVELLIAQATTTYAPKSINDCLDFTFP